MKEWPIILSVLTTLNDIKVNHKQEDNEMFIYTSMIFNHIIAGLPSESHSKQTRHKVWLIPNAFTKYMLKYHLTFFPVIVLSSS